MLLLIILYFYRSLKSYLIQIHLMLLLIGLHGRFFIPFILNSNTSYVIINLLFTAKITCKCGIQIHLMLLLIWHFLYFPLYFSYSNTSYVIINLLLFLLNLIYWLIQIHLMLLLIWNERDKVRDLIKFKYILCYY